jgi:hypothetical protein
MAPPARHGAGSTTGLRSREEEGEDDGRDEHGDERAERGTNVCSHEPMV